MKERMCKGTGSSCCIFKRSCMMHIKLIEEGYVDGHCLGKCSTLRFIQWMFNTSLWGQDIWLLEPKHIVGHYHHLDLLK